MEGDEVTTAAELREQMARDAGEERRRVESSLAEYHRLDMALKGTFVCPDCGSVQDGMKKRYEALKAQYQQFMSLHDEEEIDDPETGVRVWLEPSGRTAHFDIASLPDEVVVRLARIPGLLTANNPALDKLGDSSADLAALRNVRVYEEKAKSLKVEKKGT